MLSEVNLPWEWSYCMCTSEFRDFVRGVFLRSTYLKCEGLNECLGTLKFEDYSVVLSINSLMKLPQNEKKKTPKNHSDM